MAGRKRKSTGAYIPQPWFTSSDDDSDNQIIQDITQDEQNTQVAGSEASSRPERTVQIESCNPESEILPKSAISLETRVSNSPGQTVDKEPMHEEDERFEPEKVNSLEQILLNKNIKIYKYIYIFRFIGIRGRTESWTATWTNHKMLLTTTMKKTRTAGTKTILKM